MVRSIGAVSAVAPGLSEARIGEIDIVEGVNDQSPNQASFHTSSGASSSIFLAITTSDMSLVGVCRLHDACVARANRVSPKLPAYILPRSFLRNPAPKLAGTIATSPPRTTLAAA